MFGHARAISTRGFSYTQYFARGSQIFEHAKIETKEKMSPHIRFIELTNCQTYLEHFVPKQEIIGFKYGHFKNVIFLLFVIYFLSVPKIGTLAFLRRLKVD